VLILLCYKSIMAGAMARVQERMDTVINLIFTSYFLGINFTCVTKALKDP